MHLENISPLSMETGLESVEFEQDEILWIIIGLYYIAYSMFLLPLPWLVLIRPYIHLYKGQCSGVIFLAHRWEQTTGYVYPAIHAYCHGESTE
ncbi:hypothetical protein BDW62DRAFT_182360 [Aspergillus aurantiobrunneus]